MTPARRKPRPGSVCRHIWFVLLATISWATGVGDVGQIQQPHGAADAADEPPADWTLEGRVVGIDGNPPATSMIMFWRAVEEPFTADAERSLSWRDELNPQQVWEDHLNGKTWKPFFGSGGGDRATATGLSPGDYRVTAYIGYPGALGISEPVHLDGSRREVSVVIRLQDGPSLTVLAVDHESGKPIDAAKVLLVRDDGLIVTPWAVSPWARWMREGRFFFEHLAPGRYRLSVGRIPWEFGEPDCAPEESPIRLVIHEGKSEVITVRLKPVELAAEEIEKRWPYVVTGHVRDGLGTGMEGVEITAHIGMGTLMEGGHAVSGPDGSYTLRFPAFGRGGFVVVVGPRLPGFFEKDLYRQGDLLPLWTDETPRQTWGHPPNRWIVPHRPHTVDFVMLPAVKVSGRLLDERGAVIRNCRVSVSGPELPPASNVFASVETDDAGSFHFDSLPPRTLFQFRLPNEVTVETWLDEPGIQHIVLQRHRDAEGRPAVLIRR